MKKPISGPSGRISGMAVRMPICLTWAKNSGLSFFESFCGMIVTSPSGICQRGPDGPLGDLNVPDLLLNFFHVLGNSKGQNAIFQLGVDAFVGGLIGKFDSAFKNT